MATPQTYHHQVSLGVMEIIIVRSSLTRISLNIMARQQLTTWRKLLGISISALSRSGDNRILMKKCNCWDKDPYRETPGPSTIIRSAQPGKGFDSMINVRHSGGNHFRYVAHPEIREAVTTLVMPDTLPGTNNSKVKGQSPGTMERIYIEFN